MKTGFVRPVDYDPPAGCSYFSIRISATQINRRDVAVAGLSDEQIAWIERVLAAEKARRLELAQATTKGATDGLGRTTGGAIAAGGKPRGAGVLGKD